MTILFSILIPILLIFSGFAKAVMDLSEEGKIKFKPSRYWIKSMSSSKLTLVDDEIKEVNLVLSIQKLIKDRVLIQIPEE